ncbi:HNH endonuclease [Agathobaculum sp. Marseille-P7918]|uniref:HNH endonuclease n=1 Tax=Agathobaculum sp. Marseille-P7918 TaxID=2479843 RepID=UPI000F635CEE|nr:hypothetical protein [Agathobaculum sp. Marseille-P7918]
MNKLTIPLADKSSSEIFEQCVRGYRDTKKVRKLLRYKKDVESSAKNYLKYIPCDIEHYPQTPVSSDDKEMLVNVYKDKFSKASFSKGRAYYDKILAGASGKCAICSIGAASTLDHYLPKAEYPTLCVFPANLVPECQSCNKNKGDFIQIENEKMLLHPYFDDLSDVIWLDGKLVFSSVIGIEYYNSYTSDPVMASRISLTIEKYKLFPLFAIQANSDISNNISMWRKQLQNTGTKQLRIYFSACRLSREEKDLNSWSSALYRALERQCDEVIDWLNNNP